MPITKKIITLLLSFFVFSCKEVVVHGLDELKANEIKLILENHNIQTTKENSGLLWQVSVDARDIKRALLVLNNQRFRVKNEQASSSNNNLFISREERHKKINNLLEKEITQSLESYPFVLEAKVHLNLKQNKNIFKDDKETAAVLLLVNDSSDIEENKIKRFVYGATGIAIEDISLVVSKQQSIPLADRTIITKELRVNYSQLLILVFLLVIFFLIVIIKKVLGRKREKNMLDEKVDNSFDEINKDIF